MSQRLEYYDLDNTDVLVLDETDLDAAEDPQDRAVLLITKRWGDESSVFVGDQEQMAELASKIVGGIVHYNVTKRGLPGITRRLLAAYQQFLDSDDFEPLRLALTDLQEAVEN